MPVRYIDEEETEKSDIDPSYITTEDMPEVVECTFAADSVLAVRHELPLDPPDTGLRVPIPSYDNNPLDDNQFYSPFHLNTPSSLHTDIHYDTATNSFLFQNMIGNTPFGPSSSMSIDEYLDYDLNQSIKEYWRDKGASYTSHGNRRGGGIIPQIHVGGDIFESIFGSNTIDIRPSGNVELIFGVLHNRNDNPSIPVKQRRVTQFNFDENIQLNALAKIGDKIEFNLNYNTEAMFDFENKMKLKFEGKEDDILQLIEFGDVSLPLNSTLITGSQSLFGGKLQLKFGKLMVTAVASQKRAESQTITVSGGAQTNEFYFKADEYEENRHYFIGQFFRDHYNQYLSTLPLVSSPIVITKIEVWRTTIGSATQENRNIVAFTDLGESDPQFAGFVATPGVNYPCDTANNLPIVIDTSLYRDLSSVNNNLRSRGMTSGVDYEKVESARLLSSSEYTVNTQLGFISLNTALTADQVLAVAFQYTIIGDDHVYQVGEFSNEVSAPQCLRVKLLKSTTLDTKSPLWDLMMKNVYSLGAYQVSSEDFILNILYTGDDEGVPNGFFNLGPQKGIPLIRLMGLDSLNKQQDPYPDGIFDFLDNAATRGGTINSTNGKIYFPTVEPFGKDLRAKLTDPAIADRYAFDTLYRATKTIAQQYTSKNKYYLEGSYKSSYGSEIYLNAMNVPEGSVKVTAGGITLQENVDYTVNYSMGTVSITNQGILNSGTPISISLENQSTYSTIDQRMFGVNLDYAFSENFNIGATVLNLNERPLTQKVNYGDEPINNTIWGMNLNYKTKMPWVTKAVNLLSFHSTTMESNLQLEGEFAHFIPGHSRAIGKEGTTYIDDFESTKSTTDLRSFYKWTLASTPQSQIQMFPEANVSDNDPVRKQLGELLADSTSAQRAHHARVDTTRKTQDHTVLPHFRAYAVDELVDEVVHAPQRFEPADAEQEVRKYLRSIRRMAYLGVELRRIEVAFCAFHRRHWAHARARGNNEPLGHHGNRIAVAHPDRLLLGRPVEQARWGNARYRRRTVLPHLGAADHSAERLCHDLLSIAETQHRQFQLEHGRIDAWRIFRINACRTARQDDGRRLGCRNLGSWSIARHDLRIDAQIAHATRDELSVLRAEIEDDYPLLFVV